MELEKIALVLEPQISGDFIQPIELYCHQGNVKLAVAALDENGRYNPSLRIHARNLPFRTNLGDEVLQHTHFSPMRALLHDLQHRLFSMDSDLRWFVRGPHGGGDCTLNDLLVLKPQASLGDFEYSFELPTAQRGGYSGTITATQNLTFEGRGGSGEVNVRFFGFKKGQDLPVESAVACVGAFDNHYRNY